MATRGGPGGARAGWTSAGLVVLALTALAGGCRPLVTEVIVVVDSDLDAMQADSLQIQISASAATSFGPVGFAQASVGAALPVTLGMVPAGAGNDPFAVSVSAVRFGSVILTRNVSGVRFVHGESRVLFIPLLRRCLCQGTSCPDPRTAPECAPIHEPTLSAFDADHLPRLSDSPPAEGPASDGGAADAGTDAGADAVVGAACVEGFGACSASCGRGSYCDGQGHCAVSTTAAGLFCVAGSCLCQAGLTCQAPDAGGAGVCR
jgi:hypothetical protein